VHAAAAAAAAAAAQQQHYAAYLQQLGAGAPRAPMTRPPW
jgi:hypothetical protein